MFKTSYYAFYRETYAPAFKAIDVLLKSIEEPISLAEAAKALYMDETAVEMLMDRENIETLDKGGFLTLMRFGESAVCRLFQREIMRGLKPAYSPADIAYIYGLDEAHVSDISSRLGKQLWPTIKIPELLSQIPVFIVC
jgi:hypothetical protein